MQGTLIKLDEPKQYIRCTITDINGAETTTDYEIWRNRINDINKDSGIELKNGDMIDFNLKHVEQFPYVFAYPFISNESGVYSTTSSDLPVQKKTKKKWRVQLIFAGFPVDEDIVICDGYDTSSSGYYYFYDHDNERRRTILKQTPINRTIIDEIEEIEIEY
jgi:hypothetical protein